MEIKQEQQVNYALYKQEQDLRGRFFLGAVEVWAEEMEEELGVALHAELSHHLLRVTHHVVHAEIGSPYLAEAVKILDRYWKYGGEIGDWRRQEIKNAKLTSKSRSLVDWDPSVMPVDTFLNRGG